MEGRASASETPKGSIAGIAAGRVLFFGAGGAFAQIERGYHAPTGCVQLALRTTGGLTSARERAPLEVPRGVELRQAD